MADEVTGLKLENMKLEAENNRLKKQLTDVANRPATEDKLSVIQQVQALCSGYLKLRDQVAELQKQLDIRNEDNRRLEKIVAKFNTASENKKEVKDG